jgi:hypothetical protein
MSLGQKNYRFANLWQNGREGYERQTVFQACVDGQLACFCISDFKQVAARGYSIFLKRLGLRFF